MKRLVQVLLIVLVTWFSLSSCATMKKAQPLGLGELRLVSLEVPESFVQNLPYDVGVVFEADGQPQIKKACFRLYHERAFSPAENLTCFSLEVEANKQVSTTCRPWESPYTRISPASCSEIQTVRYGVRNYFVARVASNFLKTEYNKLECHVQYISNGVAKDSNKVTARVRIEK
jgi:hypothetical protein